MAFEIEGFSPGFHDASRKESWYVKQGAEFWALRAAVRAILVDPFQMDWTVQGLGMMRTYLDKEKKYRINLWDSRLATPNVSTMHDHPWHFKSWILNGSFRNRRYDEWMTGPNAVHPASGELYDYMQIKCGVCGGPDPTSRSTVRLIAQPIEIYTTGDTYHQNAKEIHKSLPEDGCATLNDRVPIGDGEHARVFWPAGQEWVDAKPREAEYSEIERTVIKVLDGWPA